MSNCSKCGAKHGARFSGPQYSIRTTIQNIDHTTANIYFRAGVSFDFEGTIYQFQPGQVIRLDYTLIRAALAINTNLLLFLIVAEKADFVAKYPEARAYNL